MKLASFLLVLLNLSLAYSQPSNWKWARGYSSYGSDYGWGVTVDTSGNIISIGSLHSWSLSCGNTVLMKNGSGLDFVVMKHDPNGNLLWVKSFGGTYNENANDVTTDSNGNIFVSGSFSSSVAIFGTYTVSNSGGGPSFLLKLSPTGNVLWVKTSFQPPTVGKSTVCSARAVAADRTGNVCITGYQNSSTVCFGTFTLNQASNGGGFLVKYDANGNELWATGLTGIGTCLSIDAVFDASDNIYITGQINGTITFGTFSLTSTTGMGCFIAKYDQNGNVLWARIQTGSGSSTGSSITCDKNRNVIVSGECKGSCNFGQVSFNPSTFDPILVKADSLGNFLWGAIANGAGTENGGGVTTDLNANIIWTGRFSTNPINPLTFGNITVTPVGKNPGFITRYDANGNALCADYIGCGGATPGGVAVNSSGDAFLCSEYSTSPFIVGNDILYIQTQTSYSQGHYVAKWNCGSSITGLPKNELKTPKLFPVPVDQYLYISYENDSPYSNSQLTIKNSQGQVVFTSAVSSVVDCSILIPGIYFIELSTPQGEFFNKKFVKQ